MFIGLDMFGLKDGSVLNLGVPHTSYEQLEITGGLIDDIFVDESIEIPFTIDKPEGWTFSTVMFARLQNNLEGGSAEASGLIIESIKFQKRKWNELNWIDVGELEYEQGNKSVRKLLDKVVSNDAIYEYSIIPVTSSVEGKRVLSEEVVVDFEGVFISDGDFNYRLLYDLETSDIDHNTPSSVIEPLNAKYPIVTYSNLDYASFNVEATFISAQTFLEQSSGKRQVSIRMEKIGREALLKFIKNKKPKVYRDKNGVLKLVSVVGKPQEKPLNGVDGIAKIAINFIEIGEINSETLAMYDMLAKPFAEEV